MQPPHRRSSAPAPPLFAYISPGLADFISGVQESTRMHPNPTLDQICPNPETPSQHISTAGTRPALDGFPVSHERPRAHPASDAARWA